MKLKLKVHIHNVHTYTHLLSSGHYPDSLNCALYFGHKLDMPELFTIRALDANLDPAESFSFTPLGTRKGCVVDGGAISNRCVVDMVKPL